MKFNLCWSFLALSVLQAKEVVYVIRDHPSDYNNQLFTKADLSKRLCIWNTHWEPNMWLLTKQLLEEVSDYELKTPSTNEREKMMEELRQAKWVIDCTYQLPFSYNLDPVRDEWLLKKMCIMVFEPEAIVDWNWNPEFHARVARVFTWDDSCVARNPSKYFLLRYPFYSGAQMVDPVPFAQKKLCCFINGNKGSQHSDSLYEKRREDAQIWSLNYPNDFDFYGTGWSQGGVFHRTFKGAVPGEKKVEVLRKYRFCLAYENVDRAYGWVTEKMFNCLEAGCVPIYMGVVNIDQFVPRNCYIDRTQFGSNEHLHRYLKNMDQETYEAYLHNIQAYLASDLPKEFSYERFAQYIVAGLLA